MTSEAEFGTDEGGAFKHVAALEDVVRRRRLWRLAALPAAAGLELDDP